MDLFKKKILTLPEIVFASSDPSESRKISTMVREGVLKKIAPKVYTSNLIDDAERIIARNIFPILGHLFPGAVLSFRSALEARISPRGNLYLTYSYKHNVKFPGVTLRFTKGPGPVSGDLPLNGGLYLAQEARALLENLSISRTSEEESKLLQAEEIEKIIDRIIHVQGAAGINKIRDKARELSKELGYEREFQKLEKVIGAMLSTRPAVRLTSAPAIARAAGLPYDPYRVELFTTLWSELRRGVFPSRPDPNVSSKAFENCAFFESYFSNYIEGTKFKIAEAHTIIQSGQPAFGRRADSHDILGTYQVVASRGEMTKLPETPEDFLTIMQHRHHIVLRGREDKRPGEFKLANNMAGDVAFVDSKLVRGTLHQSFSLYKALTDPFARAAFMMFVVSEVHPFDDGNGRIARIMMNAELVAQSQTKIIIPTVFREDYFGSLRKITRDKKADPFIRAMQRAQAFSSFINGEDWNQTNQLLSSMNAFLEPIDGNKIKFPEVDPPQKVSNIKKRGLST